MGYNASEGHTSARAYRDNIFGGWSKENRKTEKGLDKFKIKNIKI
jgi:hypothetical protein